VFGCSRVMVSRQDPENFDILEESINVFFSIFVERDAQGVCSFNGLIINIGDIHNMSHLEARKNEKSLQDIFKNVSTIVAYMWIIINGWTAGIETDFPGSQWSEVLNFSRQSIMKTNHADYYGQSDK